MPAADVGVLGGSGFYDFLDRVVGPCAAGSLRSDVHPGDFFLEANVERVGSVLFDLIPKIPNERTGCACADAVGPLPTRPADEPARPGTKE